MLFSATFYLLNSDEESFSIETIPLQAADWLGANREAMNVHNVNRLLRFEIRRCLAAESIKADYDAFLTSSKEENEARHEALHGYTC